MPSGLAIFAAVVNLTWHRSAQRSVEHRSDERRGNHRSHQWRITLMTIVNPTRDHRPQRGPPKVEEAHAATNRRKIFSAEEIAHGRPANGKNRLHEGEE